MLTSQKSIRPARDPPVNRIGVPVHAAGKNRVSPRVLRPIERLVRKFYDVQDRIFALAHTEIDHADRKRQTPPIWVFDMLDARRPNFFGNAQRKRLDAFAAAAEHHAEKFIAAVAEKLNIGVFLRPAGA